MQFNSDFRYDLKVGQLEEKWLAELLQSKTLEVKRDFKASQTGRVFVEFFCRGKPSGIATTEADHWAFILNDGIVIILPTERLKELVEEAQEKGKTISGGDSNVSQGALIKLERLVK
tara:strand:- start:122 stop:472 length:351 start_codon:yes stop_codon:yes gene_type:complete